jgi:UDP-N-acetylmuramate dehydrogenase
MEDMLTRIVGRNNIFRDEPLKKHSTFGIGGNAYFYIKPTTYFDMFEVISELGKRSVKWKIIGNGSNLLFSDEGYDGVIFDTYDCSREETRKVYGYWIKE